MDWAAGHTMQFNATKCSLIEVTLSCMHAHTQNCCGMVFSAPARSACEAGRHSKAARSAQDAGDAVHPLQLHDISGAQGQPEVENEAAEAQHLRAGGRAGGGSYTLVRPRGSPPALQGGAGAGGRQGAAAHLAGGSPPAFSAARQSALSAAVGGPSLPRPYTMLMRSRLTAQSCCRLSIRERHAALRWFSSCDGAAAGAPAAAGGGGGSGPGGLLVCRRSRGERPAVARGRQAAQASSAASTRPPRLWEEAGSGGMLLRSG